LKKKDKGLVVCIFLSVLFIFLFICQ